MLRIQRYGNRFDSHKYDQLISEGKFELAAKLKETCYKNMCYYEKPTLSDSHGNPIPPRPVRYVGL